MRAFTIRRALVAVIGATALLVGSVGVLTSASAAPLQSAADPDQNHPEYWVAYFTNLGYEGVICTKTELDEADTFTVPAPDDGLEWIAAIIKAGTENEIVMGIEEGDVLEAANGKEISHVILCEAKPKTETTTTTTSSTTSSTTSGTTSPSTGPVVETDITGGSSGNGLMAWVALLLGGLALTLVGLRRPVRKH
jgi:hypothetical protein